jgi:hypothetical protein
MTPEQIETLIYRLKHETWSGFQGLAEQAGTALAEQATEITELKAKLAEVMPLAKLGAMTMKTESCLAYHKTGLLLNAFACGVIVDTDDVLSFALYAPNIEATIEKILKD